VLVTTGGGGDGDALIDWVLRAYESGVSLPHRALLVLGPFMQSEKQSEFIERAARIGKHVEAITFDAHLEQLITRAAGVVAMGGYNTFCEILSFDKPAVIVPRIAPRLEQYIRAERAEYVGLTRMLPDDGIRDTGKMVEALRGLADQNPPSAAVIPGLLDGLENVERLMARWLPRHQPAPVRRRALTR
jgi:predicted glycosyltransferase